MPTFFIVHGAYGNPEGNWFPWLKEELEKLDCRVFVPKFPTPEGQNLDNWLVVAEEYVHYFDENTFFVGHSIAPAFLLSLLEKLQIPIKAGFFVSGFLDNINNPTFDTINKTFYRKFDWKKIKRSCKKFYVFHSDNDPYVPLNKGKELARRLETDPIIVKGGGHLNAESGYYKFNLLLEKIKSEL
ncbi:MAG: alpha/beta hydrolase [Candidatus Aenigmatarchaeota archaeon]